jgi:hypothetical protein
LGCSLQSFLIPADVDTLDGSAFADPPISEIRVAIGNRHFQVCGDFVVSLDGSSLIVHFGGDEHVIVMKEIRVLSTGLFASSKLKSVEFESESELCRIEPRVFMSCRGLTVLCIPSFVEAIDGSAFADCSIHEIRVAGDNPHFRVSGPFLLNSEGTSVIRYFPGIHDTLEPVYHFDQSQKLKGLLSKGSEKSRLRLCQSCLEFAENIAQTAEVYEEERSPIRVPPPHFVAGDGLGTIDRLARLEALTSEATAPF